jgi:hypothetical protein
VPRIYLDPTRTFGGALNDAEQRLAYYRKVIADALHEPTCPYEFECFGAFQPPRSCR